LRLTFTETILALPPEGRKLVDAIFGRYIVPMPRITINKDTEYICDEDLVVEWHGKNFHLEFYWSSDTGYSWFAEDSVEYSGHQKSASDEPIPPEADLWIRKIFPQNINDLNKSIFSIANLGRQV